MLIGLAEPSTWTDESREDDGVEWGISVRMSCEL